MKRSRAAYTYDIGGKPPAKRAATSTKKAAATSTKKASATKETSSSGTAQATAAAAPPSRSSDDPFGKRYNIPLGPNRELMIPQILPSECTKVIEKLLLPLGWVYTIDDTPDRSLTLSYRRWWETNGLWLESNKKALGLNAKQWKMREEAFKDDSPLEGYDANTLEEFICMKPPAGERDSNDGDEDGEEDEDEDEDEDNEDGKEDVDDDDEVRGSGNKESSADKKGKSKEADTEREALRKRLGKLASRHPEHLWVITLGGYERFRWWSQEICKRNQDDYSMYIYNDFSWYGVIEVLENMFVQFEKVLKSKNHEPLDVGNAEFEMCDDGERCQLILELFGSMIIAAIDELQKKGLFTKDSKFPNIPIILSLLIKYAWTMGRGDYGFDDNIDWVFYVVQQAEAADITLGGPSGFAKILEEIKAEASEHTAASLSKLKKGTFASKFKSYGSRGGEQYVIAKMPAAQRKKHTLGSGGDEDDILEELGLSVLAFPVRHG
ncbi:hypothetical protein CFAM422_003805 [Trichoderma lentiforme]|uniref:Uncharacterized protein n=1 Tax=Trichoderma lentiforme TaxID=1567552 RepID=A0A9P4XKQ4_9HYPO|nr:hypothetical protein CFAM422_003805 [Trichoderma lentiforme]